MRIDEFGIGMFSENSMLLVHDSLPRRRVRIAALAARPCFQFQPSFVILVHRIPEWFGVGGMNENRYAKLSALLPDGCDPRIINLHAVPFAVACIHPQALVNLQPGGAQFYFLLKLP